MHTTLFVYCIIIYIHTTLLVYFIIIYVLPYLSLPEIWGINENGSFTRSQQNSRNIIINYIRKSIVGNKELVGDIIFSELKQLHHSLIAEQKHFLDPCVVDREKSKRLLFLFQLDLLPGVKGQILESKGLRDNKHKKYVSKYLKMISWTFIVVFNLGMVYYILLFALNQTEFRQDAWFKSFLLWIIADIFIVSTIIVIFNHIYLPSFLMKDVSMTRNKISETVKNFYKKLSDGNGEIQFDSDQKNQLTFNAPQYLFLSTKLAREVLHLKEAKLIMSYESIWPKQSYKRTFEVSSQYKFSISTFVTKAVSIVLIFLISGLLTFPVSIQDVIMHSVGTVFIGYIVMIHIQLYNIYPILVVVPGLILCVVGNFIFLTCREVSRRRLALIKVEPIPDWKEGSVKESDNYKSRRRSLIEGIKVANQIKQTIGAKNGKESSTSSSELSFQLSFSLPSYDSIDDEGVSSASLDNSGQEIVSDKSNSVIDKVALCEEDDYLSSEDDDDDEISTSDQSVRKAIISASSNDDKSLNREESHQQSLLSSNFSDISAYESNSEVSTHRSSGNHELVGKTRSSSNSSDSESYESYSSVE